MCVCVCAFVCVLSTERESSKQEIWFVFNFNAFLELLSENSHIEHENLNRKYTSVEK